VAAFVIATVMIGAGIAQRTIFQGAKTSQTGISVSEEAPYLLIDGTVLNRLPGTQTLRAMADGEIFAAYGRTADMKAWLADTTYNEVTLDDEGLPTSELVPAEIVTEEPGASATEEPAETPTEAPAEGEGADEGALPAHSPVGSDLWLDEFQQSDVLIAPLQLPADMSVLVATDGVEPAPTEVTIAWPLGNGTPWAGPLIVGGGIVMAAGIFLYILGIRHARRSRGPRRKGLPLPVTEPIDLAVEGEDKGVIAATPPTRRALSAGRRSFVVLPAVAVSALLFAGCSADAWPQLAGSATPTPSASVIVPENQQATAVTKPQAERILARIAATVAEADEAMDGSLVATRLDGAALATRLTNYKLRAEISDYQALDPIASKPLEITLPESNDLWPRSVLAVVDDSETNASSIMVLTQADPWSSYKLTYQGNLEASTLMPDLPAVYLGAPRIQPDSQFMLLPPGEVAAAYADIINKGEDSEYYGLFEAEGDQFRTTIATSREEQLAEFNKTASKTGSLTFTSVPGSFEPYAIATLESGAIVAVNLNEQEIVKPTNADAVIKVDGNAEVKALSGATQSATGFTTTYSDQLFFYVPGQGSTEKIRLLGYASAILDAKVIK
jgi:hypothetical protein